MVSAHETDGIPLRSAHETDNKGSSQYLLGVGDNVPLLVTPLHVHAAVVMRMNGSASSHRGVCAGLELDLLHNAQRAVTQRVMGKSEERGLKTPAFHAQANLMTAGILS